MSSTLTMDKVLAQLSSLKAHCASFVQEDDTAPLWQADVEAVETAISILSALQDEGINDSDQVLDLLNDYRLQAAQLRECHRKYETAAKPVRNSSIYLCPECNHRVVPKHTHCHWCGRKLGGW
ncbi:MAG: hypothetical protein IJ955_06865 [Oscillospiraceae bacterium]|nr:hypothetical protein [Oscillospiraceae bacterium]